MGKSGEHKSDGLGKPAESKTDQVGSAVESDWDLFDSAGDEYDHGFDSLAPEHEEDPSPSRSFEEYAGDKEPLASSGFLGDLDEDTRGSQDIYSGGALKTGEYMKWGLPLKSERPRTEEDSYRREPHSSSSDYPQEEEERRLNKGRILLWIFIIACFLFIAFLFFRPFSHKRSMPTDSNNERQPIVREDSWTDLVSVSHRAEDLTSSLLRRFGTLAIIYPKQLEVQPIETALKNEQARRKSDSDLPLSRVEQIELIDRMLLEQILVVTSDYVDAQLKEVEDAMGKSGRQRFSYNEKQEQRSPLVEKVIDTAVLGLEGLKTLPDISGEARAYCDRVRKGFSDESSFSRWVRDAYGSEEVFRRWAKVTIAAEKYRTEKESRAGKVAEDKIRSYYQENLIFYEEPEKATVAQIFIRVPAEATESERGTREAQIRRIHDQLRSGASFGALTAKYSEGGNAGREEILGTMERDELAPELRAAVFSLRPNEISPVIRTGKGFHILKLISRNSQRTRSYDEAKGEIFSRLSQEQVRNFMPAHIAELKRGLEIKKR